MKDTGCLRRFTHAASKYVMPTPASFFKAAAAAAAALLLLVSNAPRAARAFSFGGANSYYLYAYANNDQIQVLDAMQAAGLRTLRVFIAQQWAGQKGSNSIGVPDVEHPVGVYDDTILNLIDTLMFRASQRGIKLIIALHDRYSLGCWSTDSYVSKYNIPTTNRCGSGDIGENDLSNFYNNANAAADMDRRFAHIVNHRNPNFGNRPWSNIPEAVLGFDIQNEGQAHQRNGNIPNRNWVCNRAKALKPLLSPGVLIHTGGGADIWDSVLSEHFACPAIDVVSVHSYDAGSWASKLSGVIQQARQSGKRIIVEEFGATGWNKADSLRQQIQVFQNNGVPWMVWQVNKPNKQDDFEIFTDDSSSWNVLTNNAKAAANLGGAFSWPELNGGGGGGGSKPPPPPGKNGGKSPPPPKKGTKSPPPPPNDNNNGGNGGKCDKCNKSLCAGGCKCDNNCDCRPGLGGAACDKCNMAQDQGGCKCDNNCDCKPGSCWFW